MVDLTPIIGEKVRQSYEHLKVEPEDYVGENGFLYCGKCHTPKEQVDEILGKTWRHGIPCKCEQEKKDELERIERHLHYRDELLEKCFRYPEMRTWTFENDNRNNPRIGNICRNFVDDFETYMKEGRGLMLYGSQGVGKSWFAASIANALIEKEIACKFMDFTQIANTLMELGNGRNDYIETLARYPLLILDDLDAERDTEFMNELVFSVIDARTKVRAPLVVTTNLTSADFKKPKNTSKARIISRLLQVCYPYEVVGEDQRRAELVGKYADLKMQLERERME